ncbi:ATP-grasp fold amidoligase family protein [Tenacibaculum sp. SG-28]|uniref:ATP-grasp fold amidoligase family protein n=1 Tax=Tenacibaculum sp. SG-28 TaxID=754426 RepID=UPI000CF4A7A2|nr:ATP-grasp fold amidoligase family protein [Tenacibaculum sp. SG-28]PQJ23148.1 glycosyltransferase [Tenacibaculum sp. SG-28]
MTFLPSKIYVPHLYEFFTNKKLDLNNPIEFNQKIQWYKVFYRPKILNQLVDKFAVRDYVKDKIGGQYLNECYGVYQSPSEVDFNKLPNQFVIKATHASSYNLIVKDKEKLDVNNAKLLFKKWMRTNQYYRTGQEWAYKDVQPRLIAEKFLEEKGQSSLIDYKFYCFKGEVKFLEVHLDRKDNHKRSFYDLDFKKLPFRVVSLDKTIDKEIEKPTTLNKMIALSKKLSGDFPFVRVDFYSINDKIIFGEMTFYPNDGRKDFYPEKYNKVIGDWFKLPDAFKNND